LNDDHCCPAKFFIRSITFTESSSSGESWIFRFESFQAVFLPRLPARTPGSRLRTMRGECRPNCLRSAYGALVSLRVSEVCRPLPR
jgi:hypothetical protein